MTVKDILQKKDVSFFDLLRLLKRTFSYLRKKLVIILTVGIIGAFIGLLISLLTPTRYLSRVTFVIEESKGSNVGISALAGQFGLDLGGGGGSILSGDNVFLFLKSETLLREVLLTYVDSNKNETLADRYVLANNLTKKWSSLSKSNNLSFAKYQSTDLPRFEDSLLQIIVKKKILKNDLSISRPDKKASFIQLIVATPDEILSDILAKRIVSLATMKFVQSKIKVKVQNVNMLQRRADSLSAILNNKTFGAATNQQSLIDVNPGIKVATINAEISTREKTMVGTIFAEVVKNLELAKTLLSQETPSIQIVDQSSFPLEKIYVGKVKSSLYWFSIFTAVTCIFLVVKKWIYVQSRC